MPDRTSDLYKSTSPGRTPSFNHTNIFGKITGLNSIDGLVPIANIDVLEAEFQAMNLLVENKLEIVSTSDEDKPGGLGCASINYIGLDLGGSLISENVELNGLTPVESTKGFLRLNRCINLNSQGNIGQIKTEAEFDTATMFGRIDALENEALNAIYTIPINKKGVVTGWYGSIIDVNNACVNFELRWRKPGESFQIKDSEGVNTSSVGFNRTYAGLPKNDFTLEGKIDALPGGTDIVALAQTDKDGTTVKSGFSILEWFV